MQIVIEIPDEKVNKYGNDVLEMSLTFSDRIVTQADGYAFYQLPKGHGRIVDVDTIDLNQDEFISQSDYYEAECAIDNAPTIIEADHAESEE